MKKFFSMRSFSKTERREEDSSPANIPPENSPGTQTVFAEDGEEEKTILPAKQPNYRGAEVMLGILNAHERSAERIFGKKK